MDGCFLCLFDNENVREREREREIERQREREKERNRQAEREKKTKVSLRTDLEKILIQTSRASSMGSPPESRSNLIMSLSSNG